MHGPDAHASLIATPARHGTSDAGWVHPLSLAAGLRARLLVAGGLTGFVWALGVWAALR